MINKEPQYVSQQIGAVSLTVEHYALGQHFTWTARLRENGIPTTYSGGGYASFQAAYDAGKEIANQLSDNQEE